MALRAAFSPQLSQLDPTDMKLYSVPSTAQYIAQVEVVILSARLKFRLAPAPFTFSSTSCVLPGGHRVHHIHQIVHIHGRQRSIRTSAYVTMPVC